jgi:peptidyl-prolyl cis-trans isomerase SurA
MKFISFLFLFFLAENFIAQNDSVPTFKTEEWAQKKAEQIFKELTEKKIGFEAAALLYSEDSGSAKNGGDLGWTNRGALVKEFEETAFAMEPGQIAFPFKSEFGFHIVQLLEKNGESIHARHILVKFQK